MSFTNKFIKMKIEKHWYNNSYVEKTIDKYGNTCCYKQWNDGILIIHQIWEHKSRYIWTYYENILEKRWIKISSHRVNKNCSVNHEWDFEGRRKIQYCEFLKINDDFSRESRYKYMYEKNGIKEYTDWNYHVSKGLKI